MTTEQINVLFAATLTGDYDDDAPRDAVSELNGNGNRVIYEKAAAWCQSEEPLRRARGAAILCQLRSPRTPEHDRLNTYPEPIFVNQSYKVVSQMIPAETDEQALSSELLALGHLYKEEAVPLLVPFAKHPNADIRYSVTHSLGKFPQNTAAIEHLIELTSDNDDDIRDWSTFAIGTQSELDTEPIRDALVARLNDVSEIVREEAIAGLAKRSDTRAVLPLLRLLESGSYFSHHESDFEALAGKEAPEQGWGTDDLIEALYSRYPDLLPSRKGDALDHGNVDFLRNDKQEK